MKRINGILLVLTCGIMTASASSALKAETTDLWITATNNTGVAADDFHIVIDSNGANGGIKKLTDSTVVKAGWGDNAGVAGQGTITGGTTVDFKKGPGGAPVAAGPPPGKCQFGFRNNSNYVKVIDAWWTLGGAPITDANGVTIPAAVTVDKITEYSFDYDPNSGTAVASVVADAIDPYVYARGFVAIGISSSQLDAAVSLYKQGDPNFFNYVAVAGGQIVDFQPNGGALSGVRSWQASVSPGSRRAMMFLEQQDGGQLMLLSDLEVVPEPGTIALLVSGGLLTIVRRRRPG